jgi:hypothetical protein
VLFLKDTAEIRPDEAIFRLDARQIESESQQFLRSLETYKYGTLGLCFVQNLIENSL